MLDLRLIRDESHRVKAALRHRGLSGSGEVVDKILALDVERRGAVSRANGLKARRNQTSRRIAEMKRSGEDAAAVIAEMREVGERIQEWDRTAADREASIEELLLHTPNLPLDGVPGGDAGSNRIVREWGRLPSFDFAPRPHWELGEELGLLDLARGAKISGSGFPVLRGEGARLQRVLIDYMLNIHTKEHGYVEVRVPYLVTRDALTGTGQLPKFADESYLTERDDLWLIPTAEVPVTGLHRGELLSGDELPLRYTAYSPCFRREAGAAGSDTRGMLRVHQFDKVELVRYERPERSREALEELTGEAETILQRLGLTYRVVLLAAGDLGFSSAMTYDLEVWAPGVGKWLEVSSCSTFTDFQARRSNIRFRPNPGEKPGYVHTLNGSALALPRLMVALLESYQEEDGTVRIPEALRPSLGIGRLGG